jgi:hypothetical protein
MIFCRSIHPEFFSSNLSSTRQPITSQHFKSICRPSIGSSTTSQKTSAHHHPNPIDQLNTHNSSPTMASLAHTSRTLLRAAPRSSVASLPIRALSTSASRQQETSFESPFKGNSKTSKIPDFSHYRSKKGQNSNLVFQYFMV